MAHTITTHTYQDLKNYYDENLNKDDSLVKTSNDVPTPIDYHNPRGVLDEFIHQNIRSMLWVWKFLPSYLL